MNQTYFKWYEFDVEKLGLNPDWRVVMANYVCMYVGVWCQHVVRMLLAT